MATMDRKIPIGVEIDMLPNDRKVPAKVQEDPLPIWFVTRIINKLHSLYLSVVFPFASFGKRVSIHYTCNIRNPRLIKLGHRVVVSQLSWLHGVLGGNQDGPTLIIDDDCMIGRSCQIAAKNSIHLERDVIVADGVLIQDHSHMYKDITRPIIDQGLTEGGRIRIGQGSWIGFGAAILCDRGELNLGRNCVVGANAVVTRSFPPYSVILGNPAVVLQQYDPIKQVWVMGTVRSTATQPTKEEHLQRDRAGLKS